MPVERARGPHELPFDQLNHEPSDSSCSRRQGGWHLSGKGAWHLLLGSMAYAESQMANPICHWVANQDRLAVELPNIIRS